MDSQSQKQSKPAPHSDSAARPANAPPTSSTIPTPTTIQRQSPRRPQHVALMQRTLGNRATRQLLQRAENAPKAELGGRQPTPVQFVSVSHKYVEVAVEGQLTYPDPTTDPNAPKADISVAEFGNTLKHGAIELSGSLLKLNDPIDKWVGENLSFGPNIRVTSSLAAFKVASESSYKDLDIKELGLNFGEFEVALQGDIDHQFMKSAWGKRFLGGTRLGNLLSSRQIAFSGTLKLIIKLPAEDALRLAQAAANHTRLRKMAQQNSKWIKTIKNLKDQNKALMEMMKSAKSMAERVDIRILMEENDRVRRKLLRDVAKNRRLGRKLVSQALNYLKAMSKGIVSTLKRYIPIINLYFLTQDAVKLIELAYGLITGKGYQLSFGGEEGGDGTGEELTGGAESADDAEATGDETETPTAKSAPTNPTNGVENQAAGGGDDYQQPTSLNPNAELVYQALMSRNQGWVGNQDIAMLDQIIGANLTALQMERLLASLETAKLGANPFKNLTRIIELTRQAQTEPAAPSQDETNAQPAQKKGKSGTGKGQKGGTTSTTEGAGGGGSSADDDIILLDDDQPLDTADANSTEDERVDLNANEKDANAPVPAKQNDAKTPQPPTIDPDVRDFMKRAMVAINQKGMNGYAEFKGKSYNQLSIGDVFTGMITVRVATHITDENGQKSVQPVWYGGEAQFKVLNKLGNGQIEVIRSIMQGYNQYGRFVGTIGAAKIVVRSEGELTPQG